MDQLPATAEEGNLTVGFGSPTIASAPKLEFGTVIGDHFDDQVLLIKTAWGGRSLDRDFRPPSAGAAAGRRAREAARRRQKSKPTPTLEDVQEARSATTYREMIDEVQQRRWAT